MSDIKLQNNNFKKYNQSKNRINSDENSYDENININKKKFLIIKNDHFNVNFIHFNISTNKNEQFINVIYKSPTIFLDCLVLETPWLYVKKPLIERKNTDKMFLELAFGSDKLSKQFFNILNSIDNFTNNFLNKCGKILNLDDEYKNISNNNGFLIPNKVDENFYIKMLREGPFMSDEDLFIIQNPNCNYEENICDVVEDEFNVFGTHSKHNFRIKTKKGFNNIIYNNIPSKNTIENIDIENTYVKCVIVSYGLWKYNNKYGYSWKLLKININSNENNDIKNINKMGDNKNMNIPNFKLRSDFCD